MNTRLHGARARSIWESVVDQESLGCVTVYSTINPGRLSSANQCYIPEHLEQEVSYEELEKLCSLERGSTH
jgi:hypothetical protein